MGLGGCLRNKGRESWCCLFEMNLLDVMIDLVGGGPILLSSGIRRKSTGFHGWVERR